MIPFRFSLKPPFSTHSTQAYIAFFPLASSPLSIFYLTLVPFFPSTPLFFLLLFFLSLNLLAPGKGGAATLVVYVEHAIKDNAEVCT